MILSNPRFPRDRIAEHDIDLSFLKGRGIAVVIDAHDELFR
jgi:hypothetical protein